MLAHPQSLFEATELLISKLAHYSAEEREQVMTAVFAAAEFHSNDLRKSGVLYIIHPLEVATIVASLGADVESVCAALLHDVLEDTETTSEEIKLRFGDDVYSLVEALTHQPMFSKKEYFEKVYTKGKRDIRVAIIKLADQYANHRGESALPLKAEKHEENLAELEHFYLGQLATIPDVPKELISMITQALAESHTTYKNRYT